MSINDTTEKRFESDIHTAMLSGGYTRNNDTYDTKNALFLDTLVRFVQATQPKSWQRFEMQSGTPEKFARAFQTAVDMDGLLSVMRNGFKHRGIPFRVCYFKPESGLNQTAIDNYNANEITVNRQWYYSANNKNSVDMVIAVNGIPVFAFELKNQYTGQDIENAKRQWMYDRDPRENCFRFNNRVLAFFCVDQLEACMTTKLAGKNTIFLPFNQGSNGAGNDGGKGNPPNPNGYPTAYLWENVFSRDSMMDILQKFMSYRKDKKMLLFPRYHQLDVVRSLIRHVRQFGAGHNYLIQHSAGSGKSNSIAWTAYRLAALFNDEDKPVFSSVIIVTDRRVLDAQLQETISGFDHKLGAIETIDEKKTSKNLRDAINDGVRIIVTTLQKFPVIYQEVDKVEGRNFAVIVDEAHSSQTGSSAIKLKTALADTEAALREYAEIEGKAEDEIDRSDKIVQEIITQGKHPNLSFFAFTATPKAQTLEMFGEPYPDGSFQMFDAATFNSFLSIIDCKTNRVMDANYAIENDFATILSDLIRSKIIVPKIKKRGLSFDDNGHTFLIDGDRLYLPAQIIKLILTKMRTTHSLDSLMRTLKQTGALNSTDGNSHPVELHDSNGKHIRLYLYDISLDILDADIIYMLRNLDKDAFLLSNEETPTENFLNILSDGNGRLAGKQICYEGLENGHGYVTGQSGWGKTYLLCQLIAKYFNLGHKIVIFDSSDSFEYSALCRNLSKVFVDNFVKIYDLDKEGIPVNFFKTECIASLPSQKKELLGILQSGIDELSASQTNALRRLLSSIINKLGKNGRVTCTAIINELNNGKTEETSATYESLLNRLEPLIEDIEERGMADRTWKHFLDRSRIITIIRTDPAYTESGNQLIDMMLATLYNYQCDNPQIPLDVFIDELQNQNFSKTSPIRKVLKEGRRFHISFFGATQDYYPRNTELGSVMGKAGTQIFLRPTPNSENVVASELRYRKADMLRFDSMQRGDIIVKGNLYSKESGCNVPTTLSGHVDDCPKIPSNYYGNVL